MIYVGMQICIYIYLYLHSQTHQTQRLFHPWPRQVAGLLARNAVKLRTSGAPFSRPPSLGEAAEMHRSRRGTKTLICWHVVWIHIVCWYICICAIYTKMCIIVRYHHHNFVFTYTYIYIQTLNSAKCHQEWAWEPKPQRICCNNVLLPTCLIIPSKRSPRYCGPWMEKNQDTKSEILYWCIMYAIVLNLAGTCVSGWCDPCWPLCWGGQLCGLWLGFIRSCKFVGFLLGPEVGVELFAYAASASLPWIDGVWTRVF